MTHRWKVYRSGGVDQVALSSRDDLIHLASLDPKLWVALSMPTSGVHVDRRTLALLDTDHDGYVRRPEVLAAVAWMCSAYRDPGTLFTGGDTIALDQIADGPILRSARRLLVTLGKPDARSIAISDVAEATAMFAHRVRPVRGGHADLRLLRLDRCPRPAGHVRRAAHLRPVRRACRTADRATGLGGRPAGP